jgi:hypothetical protein
MYTTQKIFVNPSLLNNTENHCKFFPSEQHKTSLQILPLPTALNKIKIQQSTHTWRQVLIMIFCIVEKGGIYKDFLCCWQGKDLKRCSV